METLRDSWTAAVRHAPKDLLKALVRTSQVNVAMNLPSLTCLRGLQHDKATSGGTAPELHCGLGILRSRARTGATARARTSALRGPDHDRKGMPRGVASQPGDHTRERSSSCWAPSWPRWTSTFENTSPHQRRAWRRRRRPIIVLATGWGWSDVFVSCRYKPLRGLPNGQASKPWRLDCPSFRPGLEPSRK